MLHVINILHVYKDISRLEILYIELNRTVQGEKPNLVTQAGLTQRVVDYWNNLRENVVKSPSIDA